MLFLTTLAFATAPLSDDFEDGVMPPWRPIAGGWVETGGAMLGAHSEPGIGVSTFAEHNDLRQRITVTLHVGGVGTGGFVYQVGNDESWCAVWAGHGTVWVGTDSSGEELVYEGVDPGTTEEVIIVVDDEYTWVSLDGVEVYAGETDCGVDRSSGDIGLTAVSGLGEAAIYDLSLVLGGRDRDGDGSDDDDDCAPDDATIFPGADEVWYDGVDSDCLGNDDFDQDGDDVTVDEDCDDEDAFAYPGAEDLWYDGRDSDCAGNDDFDADGDGYAVEGTGDDCNDGDATTYPGATTDEHDGIDHDCDGFIPNPDYQDTGDAEDSGDGAEDTSGGGGGGGGCACESGTPAGAAAGLLGVAVVVRRRRRG